MRSKLLCHPQHSQCSPRKIASTRFLKIMAQGSGIPVTKHNRGGGRSLRLLRYDAAADEVSWRWPGKAGLMSRRTTVAVVRICAIHRLDRVVLVSIRGYGVIAFEPKRLTDAIVLQEGLTWLYKRHKPAEEQLGHAGDKSGSAVAASSVPPGSLVNCNSGSFLSDHMSIISSIQEESESEEEEETETEEEEGGGGEEKWEEDMTVNGKTAAMAVAVRGPRAQSYCLEYSSDDDDNGRSGGGSGDGGFVDATPSTISESPPTAAGVGTAAVTVAPRAHSSSLEYSSEDGNARLGGGGSGDGDGIDATPAMISESPPCAAAAAATVVAAAAAAAAAADCHHLPGRSDSECSNTTTCTATPPLPLTDSRLRPSDHKHSPALLGGGGQEGSREEEEEEEEEDRAEDYAPPRGLTRSHRESDLRLDVSNASTAEPTSRAMQSPTQPPSQHREPDNRLNISNASTAQPASWDMPSPPRPASGSPPVTPARAPAAPPAGRAPACSGGGGGGGGGRGGGTGSRRLGRRVPRHPGCRGGDSDARDGDDDSQCRDGCGSGVDSDEDSGCNDSDDGGGFSEPDSVVATGPGRSLGTPGPGDEPETEPEHEPERPDSDRYCRKTLPVAGRRPPRATPPKQLGRLRVRSPPAIRIPSQAGGGPGGWPGAPRSGYSNQ